jgi:hypothetical protein
MAANSRGSGHASLASLDATPGYEINPGLRSRETRGYNRSVDENEITPDYFGLGNVRSVHNANCSAEKDFGLFSGGIAEARQTRFVSTPG